MNTFEINKFAGAFLGTLLFILAIGYLGNALVPIPQQEHHGEAAGHGAPAASKAAAPAVADAPIADRLKTADAAAGEQAFGKKCAQCHTANKGEPAKVGPNLYGVVGGPHGHMAGFAYSDAMKKASGEWTYEHLDAFIANPKGAVPGTKMTFAGSKDAKERANLIAFLRSKADSPKPLP